MKLSNELLRETAKYVEQYMLENFSDKLVFHSYRHTARVVRACDLLSMESDLSKHDRHLIHLAGWFSNIGYKEDPDKHEEQSAKHAKHFFEAKGWIKMTFRKSRNV